MISNMSIFFGGQLISGFAFEMFHNAVAFHILNTTGSPLKFALAYFFDNLPKLIVLQAAGLVVDRFKRKTIFVLIDLLQATYFISFYFILKYNDLSINSLFYFTFIAGLFKAFSYPTTKAIVPLLAKDEKRMKASSFEVSNDKIARTLAPFVAILVFAKYGIEVSVLVSSIMYLSSAILKSFLIIKEVDSSMLNKKIYASLKSGFKTLFVNKALTLAWINSVITQFMFHPFLRNVIPNLLKKNSEGIPDIGPTLRYIVTFLGKNTEDIYMALYAILSLASTVGVIFSLMFFQTYGTKINTRRGMKISTFLLVINSFLSSILILYFGVYGNLSSSYLIYFLFPLSMVFYFSLNAYTVYFTFYYQERIEKVNMGRFVANLMSIFMAVKAVGHLLYGYMLEQGFILPVVAIILSSIVKVILFKKFEKEDICES